MPASSFRYFRHQAKRILRLKRSKAAAFAGWQQTENSVQSVWLRLRINAALPQPFFRILVIDAFARRRLQFVANFSILGAKKWPKDFLGLFCECKTAGYNRARNK